MSELVAGLSSMAPGIMQSLVNATLAGLLITSVVWLVLRRSPQTSAATRYGIWWLMLLLIVALPLIGFRAQSEPPTPFAQGEAPRLAMESFGFSTGNVVFVEPNQVPRTSTFRVTSNTQKTVAASAVTSPSAPRSEPTLFVPIDHSRSNSIGSKQPGLISAASATSVLNSSGPGTWGRAISAFSWVRHELISYRWTPYAISVGGFAALLLLGVLLVSAALLTRLLWSYHRLLALKRRSDSLPDHLAEKLYSVLYTASGGSRKILLRHSEEIPIPTALGLLNPVILFPTHLLEDLTENDLLNIALHEYAHLCRRDDWTNLLQRIIEAVFFFHPGVFWIGRQMCLQREIACDDWVVAHTGRARSYAACLTRLVALTPWTRRYVPAPGVLKTKSQFARRIETLLNRRRNASPQVSRRAVLVSALALGALLMQMAKVPPVIAVLDPVDVLLQGPLPTTFEASPRFVSSQRGPLKLTPVTCSEVKFPCNLAVIGCDEPAISVPVAPTAPANVVFLDKLNAPCVWCGTHCPSSKGPVVWSPSDQTFMTTTKDRGWTDAGPAYKIEYDHGESESVTQRQLVNMLTMGITADYVREIRGSGLKSITVNALIALKRHGIDGDFVEELTESGLKDLTAEDVIKLHRHGIDGDDVEDATTGRTKGVAINDLIKRFRHGISDGFATATGRSAPRFSEAVLENTRLRSNGVDTDYIEALKNTGLAALDADELISLHSNGVGADFVDAALGYSREALDARSLVSMHANGISKDFIGSLKSAGVNGLTPRQIVKLHAQSVDPEFTATAMATWDDISIGDITQLKRYGVTPEFMVDVNSVCGLDLSPEDVIDLHSYGIDAELVEAAQFYKFGDKLSVGDLIDLNSHGISGDDLEDFSELDMRFSLGELITLTQRGVTAEFLSDIEEFDLDGMSVEDIIDLRDLGLSPAALDDMSNGHLNSR